MGGRVGRRSCGETWVGRGDASTVRIAVRIKPRQNWKYQIKFLEASLQLGPDGTVPESELQPEPGEDSDDDARSTDTYGQLLPPGYSSWAGP